MALQALFIAGRKVSELNFVVRKVPALHACVSCGTLRIAFFPASRPARSMSSMSAPSSLLVLFPLLVRLYFGGLKFLELKISTQRYSTGGLCLHKQ